MDRAQFVRALVGFLAAAGPPCAPAGEAPRGRELAAGRGPAKVAFSPDGRWLASGLYDGAVTLWDLAEVSR